MNANQLYNNTSVLLYNILKIPELRSEMVMNLNFRKSLIIQVNQLLGLEKDFDALINDEKLSLVFAQIIVNELNTEVQIEKPDNSVVQDFENSFQELINYVDATFPKLLFSANLNFNEIINTKMILGLPEFIKNQNMKIAESKKNNPIEQITEQNLQNNDNTNQINDQNSTTNTNNNFTSSYNTANNNQQNMQDFSKMPFNTPNPMLDPRFYPYKTKPKSMPYLKKAAFIFYALITVLVLFLFYYSNSYLGIKLYTNANITRIIITKAVDSSYLFSPSQTATTPNEVFVSISTFSTILIPILFIIITVFLGFSVFSQRNMRREKYHIGNVTIYLGIILIASAMFFFLQFAVQNLFKGFITTCYKSNIKWVNGNDGQITVLINALEKSTAFYIVHYASIVLTIFAVIEFIILIFMIIYNPRVDREKLQLANIEYQKLITSKIRGEYYQIDPKLFDDEEEEKDKKNSKHKKNKSK